MTLKRLNQNGFHVTIILVLVLVLAVIASAGWYVSQKSSLVEGVVVNLSSDKQGNIGRDDIVKFKFNVKNKTIKTINYTGSSSCDADTFMKDGKSFQAPLCTQDVAGKSLSPGKSLTFEYSVDAKYVSDTCNEFSADWMGHKSQTIKLCKKIDAGDVAAQSGCEQKAETVPACDQLELQMKAEAEGSTITLAMAQSIVQKYGLTIITTPGKQCLGHNNGKPYLIGSTTGDIGRSSYFLVNVKIADSAAVAKKLYAENADITAAYRAKEAPCYY